MSGLAWRATRDRKQRSLTGYSGERAPLLSSTFALLCLPQVLFAGAIVPVPHLAIGLAPTVVPIVGIPLTERPSIPPAAWGRRSSWEATRSARCGCSSSPHPAAAQWAAGVYLCLFPAERAGEAPVVTDEVQADRAVGHTSGTP